MCYVSWTVFTRPHRCVGLALQCFLRLLISWENEWWKNLYISFCCVQLLNWRIAYRINLAWHNQWNECESAHIPKGMMYKREYLWHCVLRLLRIYVLFYVLLLLITRPKYVLSNWYEPTHYSKKKIIKRVMQLRVFKYLPIWLSLIQFFRNQGSC